MQRARLSLLPVVVIAAKSGDRAHQRAPHDRRHDGLRPHLEARIPLDEMNDERAFGTERSRQLNLAE